MLSAQTASVRLSQLLTWGKAPGERRALFPLRRRGDKMISPRKLARSSKRGEKQKRDEMIKSVRKLSEPDGDQRGMAHFLQRRPLCREQEVPQKIGGEGKQIQREYGRGPMWPYYKAYTAGTIFFNSSAL